MATIGATSAPIITAPIGGSAANALQAAANASRTNTQLTAAQVARAAPQGPLTSVSKPSPQGSWLPSVTSGPGWVLSNVARQAAPPAPSWISTGWISKVASTIPATVPPVSRWTASPASGTLLPLSAGWVSHTPAAAPAGGVPAATTGAGNVVATTTPGAIGPSSMDPDTGAPVPDNMIGGGPSAASSPGPFGLSWTTIGLIGGAGVLAYLFFRKRG